MRYLRAYQFVFDSPSWLANLLLGALCQFVPVVGPMVLLGYQYEIVESLHYNGDKRYPDFNFNRLTNYLMRGIWPFLIQSIVVLPVAILAMFFSMIMMVLAASQGDHQAKANASPVLVFGILFLVSTVAVIGFFVLMFIIGPMMLRAGLSQELALNESWLFTKDFLRRVGKDFFISQLFNLVATWCILMAGMLVFCVGIYPAAVLAIFGHQHLMYQLYELYLQRGGSEIPLKITEAAN